MSKRAVFFSPKCLFDLRSGAAASVLATLETLAANGWEVETVTATLCDGRSEYPHVLLLGPEGAKPEHRGKWIRRFHSGVMHHMLHTRSTMGANMAPDEAAKLTHILEQVLKNPADLAITYGSSGLSRAMQHKARRRVRRMVFYLANDTYTDPAVFGKMDAVVCPSRFLSDFYNKRMGIAPYMLQDVIDERFFLPAAETAGRGFITYINPSLQKGATLFMRLADMALRELPEATFLVVEGRFSLSEWKAAGIDMAIMPNVFWLPNQAEMKRVYRATRVLLFPTFWREAAGRCIVEAQLSGIPVIASDRGGVPAQLNGGGYCLPNPPGCETNFSRIPTQAEVRPWLDILKGLMNDSAAYEAACSRALTAAAPFHPDTTRRATVAFYEGLL